MQTTLSRFVFVGGISASLLACVLEDGAPHRHGPQPSPSSGAGSPPSAGSSDSPGTGKVGPDAGAVAPMLVAIDTGEVMTAVPGQGVGVFTEYKKGGTWHIWWTCDTAKTNQTCDFAVSVTAGSGAITGVDASELEGGFSSSPAPWLLETRVTTSSQIHGIRFSTEPGATITLDASVDGMKDGSFLFFVQDGKVNGGYTGTLTNPLKLQGKTP